MLVWMAAWSLIRPSLEHAWRRKVSLLVIQREIFELGGTMASLTDPDYVNGNHKSDSSDEDASDSDDETIVLKAVNTIIKRSLKRTRMPSKIPNTKRMKIVRDRRQGRQVVDKDVCIRKSRYNVNYVIQIMNFFYDGQKQYIRDIDFGPILDLNGGSVPWSFVQWLIDHVEVKEEKMIFDQKSIEISTQSFGHALGVPTEGIPVPPESKYTTAEFLQCFGLSELPSIKYFGDKIMKKGQEKDDFIRSFMTVALSSFYCLTSSTKPSTAYLGGLINVDHIKLYNWGNFFQVWNLWYINKYQKCSSTLAVCNYYIAVRYLDFLDFGSLEIQSTLPRISVWKVDMIKNFIKLDMDDDNYYGKLHIKDIMETCYSQVTLINSNHTTYSADSLRLSMDSIQHCTFDDKIKDTICSLFESYTQDETEESCSKVEVLLISVLKSLVEHNCISTSSQSTKKINCSSQDENKSADPNDSSENTLKLPSSDTSNNL